MKNIIKRLFFLMALCFDFVQRLLNTIFSFKSKKIHPITPLSSIFFKLLDTLHASQFEFKVTQ